MIHVILRISFLLLISCPAALSPSLPSNTDGPDSDSTTPVLSNVMTGAVFGCRSTACDGAELLASVKDDMRTVSDLLPPLLYQDDRVRRVQFLDVRRTMVPLETAVSLVDLKARANA